MLSENPEPATTSRISTRLIISCLVNCSSPLAGLPPPALGPTACPPHSSQSETAVQTALLKALLPWPPQAPQGLPPNLAALSSPPPSLPSLSPLQLLP